MISDVSDSRDAGGVIERPPELKGVVVYESKIETGYTPLVADNVSTGISVRRKQCVKREDRHRQESSGIALT
jgi:hypothetical protein